MKSEQKKVSIIIPYYNTMDFVEECLKSVIDQTYTNLEIIIINDGSDDKNTQALEKLINDDRIVYIKNPTRQGVAYARNQGISRATGSFLFFMDSDDLLRKDAIALLVKNIKGYPLIKGSTQQVKRPKDLQKKEDKKGTFSVENNHEII